MKAQERHELRENDLAGWLQYGLWAFLKTYGSYILLGLSLAFLGIQVWRLYSQKQENNRLQAWRDYNELSIGSNPPEFVLDQAFGYYINTQIANTTADRKDAESKFAAAIATAKDRPSALQDIIDKHDIKPLQTACYLTLGNFYHRLVLLPEIMDRMKLTRREVLDKAGTAYRAALNVQPNDQLTSAQAHLGIAAVFEDQGEWDKARDEYKILTADPGPYAGTPLAKFAAERAAKLVDRQNAPRLTDAIKIFQPAPASPNLLDPAGGGLNSLLSPPTRQPSSILQGLNINPSAPTRTTTSPAQTSPAMDPLLFLHPAGPTSKPQ